MTRDFARHVDDLETVRRVALTDLGSGRGELFYFATHLPPPLASWRQAFYRHLAPVANRWNQIRAIEYRYPADLHDFLQHNTQAGQIQPQSHLSRLVADDYLALHSRNEGEHVFPLQLVALLSAPGRDFDGGEFVMTEQRPRMQTRPIVLPLGFCDAAIISTAERPFKGSKGHYRVTLKHAISPVRSGERIGLELFFHHAR
jgi:hypothetical protein